MRFWLKHLPEALPLLAASLCQRVERHDSEDHAGLGSVLSYFTGVTVTNKEGNSYAMKIKEKWYDEDQAAKQKAGPDQVDDAIRAGVEAVSNAYTPGQAAPGVTKSPVTIR